METYSTLQAYLGNKTERPFGNNTRVRKNADNIIVRLHATDIAIFTPDGSVTFDNGGWATPTTKDRLNRLWPCEGLRIIQERGTWQVWDYYANSTRPYLNGMTVYPDGRIDYHGAEPPNPNAVKKLIKNINRYATSYATALVAGEIGKPTEGDCWYCLFENEAGQSLGDITHNTDHLLSHIEENYFVPSLLVRAKNNPADMCPLSQGLIYRLWYENYEADGFGKDILVRDVQRMIARYLKKQFGLPCDR